MMSQNPVQRTVDGHRRLRAFPALIRAPIRWLLRVWSHIPRAHGYLYHIVEEFGDRLATKPLPGHLANGATMRCDLRDSMQRQIYFLGAYEPVETYLFPLLLRPGMVVVDAGAHIGQYTLLAALEVGPQGAVHAFEPVPKNFDQLAFHVRENHLESTVKTNMLALWHEADTLSLNLSGEQPLNPGAYTAGLTPRSVDSVACKAVSLDSYVRENHIARVDVIKMDIEGSEWNALKGARDVLARWQPTILMELSRPMCSGLGYQPEQIWEFLKSFGYKMWVIAASPVGCCHLLSPPPEDFANVIFHTNPLPDTVVAGWSLRSVRSANARRTRGG
jgi:FkbM family methyltransferase